uniref:N-acetyltransferase 9 n=1 Tax=Oryzias sinensis TaxID=183150 RepID=A0A8C7X8Z8_9TELE
MRSTSLCEQGSTDGRAERVKCAGVSCFTFSMKINENTMLEGQRVLLVPYNAEHVPRYHEWMKSPELQQLTASEPLTLEQEYDMQRSWREDDDKCTFIILDTQKWADPSVDEETCMLGDVNIFLTDSTDPSLAELEVMIAGDSCLLRKPFLALSSLCSVANILSHNRRELQRQRHREGGDTYDDALWSQETWDQKVSGKDWFGQSHQHRHVQKAALPGGVCVSGVQRGDPRVNGGRVCSEDITGGSPDEGKGLQTNLQRQTCTERTERYASFLKACSSNTDQSLQELSVSMQLEVCQSIFYFLKGNYVFFIKRLFP